MNYYHYDDDFDCCSKKYCKRFLSNGIIMSLHSGYCYYCCVEKKRVPLSFAIVKYPFNKAMCWENHYHLIFLLFIAAFIGVSLREVGRHILAN